VFHSSSGANGVQIVDIQIDTTVAETYNIDSSGGQSGPELLMH
jgi:hypothetical protein